MKVVILIKELEAYKVYSETHSGVIMKALSELQDARLQPPLPTFAIVADTSSPQPPAASLPSPSRKPRLLPTLPLPTPRSNDN